MNDAASSFSNNVYDWNQTHLAQAVTLKSGTADAFAWEAVASMYNYLDDKQRVPAAALPGASTGGAGTINRLNGTIAIRQIENGTVGANTSSPAEPFKVQGGVSLEALHAGDKVGFTATDTGEFTFASGDAGNG